MRVDGTRENANEAESMVATGSPVTDHEAKGVFLACE